MMDVYLNESAITIENNITLLQFLEQYKFLNQPVAVAINHDFVARQDYGKTFLHAKDKIDIVAPMQGG